MHSEDPDQLTHFPILCFECVERTVRQSSSTLPDLDPFGPHPGFMSNSSQTQSRTFTQNMHHISCIRRSLLSSYAAHTADGCAWLRAPQTVRSVFLSPTCLYGGHTCQLTILYIVDSPILFTHFPLSPFFFSIQGESGLLQAKTLSC